MSPIDEAVALGLSNPELLAPLAALPILTAGYVRYRISARDIGLNFQLRQLESVELDRALLLYKKVSDRLYEIHKEAEDVEGPLLARYQQRKTLRQKFAEEREDLEQYAAHLRAAISRLRGKPVLRFRSWLHIFSAQFALSRSLLTYLAICSAGLLAVYCTEQRLLLDALDMNSANLNFAILPLWNRIPSPLLYANWVAAACMAVTMPVLYLYRRTILRGEHATKLRSFKEFADADPDRLIQHLRVDAAACEKPFQPPDESDEATNCFAILGISPSATIEQVKEAYKLQVKQNHPDRVQGMSLLFRELAEAETKKLNAAYEEALHALSARESVTSHAMASCP